MTFTEYILTALDLTSGGKHFLPVTLWALRPQKAIYNRGADDAITRHVGTTR